jgi:hypothetical protein
METTMKLPKRVQQRRIKGWRKPTGSVVVSRPSEFGNPWKVVPKNGKFFVEDTQSTIVIEFKHETAAKLHAIAMFRGMVRSMGATDPERWRLWCERLRGRKLVCFCPLPRGLFPDLCHARVLIEEFNK